jgi:ketosteroid isomerase-like protein
MHKRMLALFAVLAVFLSIPATAQTITGAVDKAYLQKILDTCSSFDVEKVGQYYVQGPGHLFFDITPLKYANWDEYKAGVQLLLKQYSSFKFTINDDLQIHPAEKITWVDGTLNVDATAANGEKQPLVLRWTAIFEKQSGRWIIAHEHVSAPLGQLK